LIRRVVIIHSLVAASWLILTWRADQTEIGPGWAFISMLDYPSSLLLGGVLESYFQNGTIELKCAYILGVFAVGTIQWIAIAVAISKCVSFFRQDNGSAR
jgi:hypothetical protein